jgi:hypothetical protein
MKIEVLIRTSLIGSRGFSRTRLFRQASHRRKPGLPDDISGLMSQRACAVGCIQCTVLVRKPGLPDDISGLMSQRASGGWERSLKTVHNAAAGESGFHLGLRHTYPDLPRASDSPA